MTLTTSGRIGLVDAELSVRDDSAQDSVDVVIPFTMKIEGPAIFGT